MSGFSYFRKELKGWCFVIKKIKVSAFFLLNNKISQTFMLTSLTVCAACVKLTPEPPKADQKEVCTSANHVSCSLLHYRKDTTGSIVNTQTLTHVDVQSHYMVPDRNIYVTHNRQNIQKSERTAHVGASHPQLPFVCLSVTANLKYWWIKRLKVEMMKAE